MGVGQFACRIDCSHVRYNRATEMDVTMIGLQNAGKTSLLRVISVSCQRHPTSSITEAFADHFQGGEFTLE